MGKWMGSWGPQNTSVTDVAARAGRQEERGRRSSKLCPKLEDGLARAPEMQPSQPESVGKGRAPTSSRAGRQGEKAQTPQGQQGAHAGSIPLNGNVLDSKAAETTAEIK